MNMVRISLLFFSMMALANASFAGQGDDEKEGEPECDYTIEAQTL